MTFNPLKQIASLNSGSPEGCSPNPKGPRFTLEGKAPQAKTVAGPPRAKVIPNLENPALWLRMQGAPNPAAKNVAGPSQPGHKGSHSAALSIAPGQMASATNKAPLSPAHPGVSTGPAVPAPRPGLPAAQPERELAAPRPGRPERSTARPKVAQGVEPPKNLDLKPGPATRPGVTPPALSPAASPGKARPGMASNEELPQLAPGNAARPVLAALEGTVRPEKPGAARKRRDEEETPRSPAPGLMNAAVLPIEALRPPSPLAAAPAPKKLPAPATQKVESPAASEARSPSAQSSSEPAAAPESRGERSAAHPERSPAPVDRPAEQRATMSLDSSGNSIAPAAEATPVVPLHPALTQLPPGALEDPSLRLQVQARSAMVSVETLDGERLALRMSVRDGVAMMTAIGPAAGMVEAHRGELSVALAREGLSLGTLDLSQGERHARPEARDRDPPTAAPPPPAARPVDTTLDSVSSTHRMHVTA